MADQKVNSEYFLKFGILKVFEKKESDKFIIVSCKFSSDIPYFNLLPTGQVTYCNSKLKSFQFEIIDDEREKKGIILIDKEIEKVSIAYNYIESDNNSWLEGEAKLKDLFKECIITTFQSITHVVFFDDLKVISFGGDAFEISYPYILFLPQSDYVTFDTFAILNIATKESIDLNERFLFLNFVYSPPQFNEAYELIGIRGDCFQYFSKTESEYINVKLNKLFEPYKIIPDKLRSEKSEPEVLKGNWDKGIVLGKAISYCTSSLDGTFYIKRTFISELLYQVKSLYNKSLINKLSEFVSKNINENFVAIDVILPVPPSVLVRPFQPVYEICQSVSNQLEIPFDSEYIKSNFNVKPSKFITDTNERRRILSEKFILSDNRYKGKKILLIDDHCFSMGTINTITSLLKSTGEVKNVYVLVLTKSNYCSEGEESIDSSPSLESSTLFNLSDIPNEFTDSFISNYENNSSQKTHSQTNIILKSTKMKELDYDPQIRQFRYKLTNNIPINGSQRAFIAYYIHDYYPKNHFGDEVDSKIKSIRKMVYDFKDGRNSLQMANLFTEAIRSLNLDLNNTCLLIIPASTPEKTDIRFRTFCNTLCSNLHIVNAYSSITTESHEATKGTSGGNKIKHFSFNSSLYKNKNIFLIDDVRTSGTTFKQVLEKLMSTGASNVTGFFLAKTVSYLNS